MGQLRSRSTRFDLVLSDISMPRMGGIELVNAMAKECIEVPIAMMTGNPSPDLESQLPAGTKVLIKPLRGEVLEELLRVF